MRQIIGQNDSCSFYAFTFSVTLHILVLGIASGIWTQDQSSIKKAPIEKVVFLELRPEAEQESIEVNASPPSAPKSPPIHNQPVSQSTAAPAVTTASTKQPASLAAPSAPSAEDWAFAARYTNKNSKGYRYNWGQQVRSLMGTAVEGPDQGVVRFRVEIAPDGSLAQLVTLWTTSKVAEQLARKAVESMPPLPPTPTGKPLIFEKTISFTPYASDGPPSYRDDCLPDPPPFRNPFIWDGKSPQVRDERPITEKLDPLALEECLRQLPKDSIEAEMARDQRAMERWGWSK
ncbi:MAG: hypothetical protein RLZZ464_1900 [Pseudomonadota bacterium]|jgi:hypothetical protein